MAFLFFLRLFNQNSAFAEKGLKPDGGNAGEHLAHFYYGIGIRRIADFFVNRQ